MAYTEFNSQLPDASTQGITQFASSIRKNQEALRDAITLGFAMGWDMVPYGTDKSNPTSVVFDRGVERLKADLRYGTLGGEAGQVISSVFTYSVNAGASYTTIGKEFYTYDASSNLTRLTWVSAV